MIRMRFCWMLLLLVLIGCNDQGKHPTPPHIPLSHPRIDLKDYEIKRDQAAINWLEANQFSVEKRKRPIGVGNVFPETEGYMITCKEYRTMVFKQRGTGRAIHLIGTDLIATVDSNGILWIGIKKK